MPKCFCQKMFQIMLLTVDSMTCDTFYEFNYIGHNKPEFLRWGVNGNGDVGAFLFLASWR
eukprot:scaffold10288_cov137-Skeletonema_marinoi.AAC.3